jgi:hypothetical protein
MNCLSENKQAIKYIGTLPEHGWLDICDTDDRVGTFHFVRDIYRLIADNLQDFFECREPEEIDIICKDETLAKLIEEKAEEYQLIYSVLFKAWKYVKVDLLEIHNSLKIPIEEVRLTPINFLLSICREEAENMLEDIVFPERVTGNNYSEYCVSGSYKLFKEGNKIVRRDKAITKQWLEIMQSYGERYTYRVLCLDLLKRAASKDHSVRLALKHLDDFHGLALINAPALFHPERVKDYLFQSHIVKDGRIILKPKRTKKS